MLTFVYDLVELAWYVAKFVGWATYAVLTALIGGALNRKEKYVEGETGNVIEYISLGGGIGH